MEVELEDGTIIRRHHDQLIARTRASRVQVIPVADQFDTHGEDAQDITLPQARRLRLRKIWNKTTIQIDVIQQGIEDHLNVLSRIILFEL